MKGHVWRGKRSTLDKLMLKPRANTRDLEGRGRGTMEPLQTHGATLPQQELTQPAGGCPSRPRPEDLMLGNGGHEGANPHVGTRQASEPVECATAGTSRPPEVAANRQGGITRLLENSDFGNLISFDDDCGDTEYNPARERQSVSDSDSSESEEEINKSIERGGSDRGRAV
ncbi:unnamed protein product [Euphydryas editha]|uniref:Uncharacterized protein n=1 Tax=Euphydryas editha TaxID=104508 RepID=A0AAU9VEG2_EUPED|nr:unnamed protein product [Euphydryas editha]